MKHILMDKAMLAQCLKSGYMENDLLNTTKAGTPQGGNISPIFANIALDSMEEVVLLATKGLSKIYVARYADNFIVSSEPPEILESKNSRTSIYGSTGDLLVRG